MKNTILLLLLAIAFSACAQQTTLKVTGKNLTTTSGQVLTLRGINYPIIDDGTISLSVMAQYRHKIDQAALTGANAIRLPWYTDGTHWRDANTPGTVSGYLTNGNLSDLLGYCHTKGMIPILEIHNITCSNTWSSFTNVAMAWWKSAAVLNLIESHKAYLIINLANEFGYARWSGNTATGLNTFKTNYNTAIADMRALGVKVPIMIDAPDCGQSSTELLSIAESMVSSDPEHNLIFSAHAYWSGYATTLAAVQQKLNEAQNTNVCFILGEVASTQDGNACGDISLAALYPVILQEACTRNIGWLAWTFDQDCSSPREMTTNGEFSNLTAYGNDLVNNASYGLKSTGGCGALVLAAQNFDSPENFTMSPNPSNGMVSVANSQSIQKATILDFSGRQLREIRAGFDAIDVSFLPAGHYIIRFEANGKSTNKKLIRN